MKFLTAAISMLFAAANVSAHSWTWCADYNVQTPGAELMGPDETDPARRIYDDSLCDGYPADFGRGGVTSRNDFGADFGFNVQPQFNSGELCVDRPNTYTDAFPQPVYTAGDIITVAYPAKNHVAALTTNPFIPDTRIAMYYSRSLPQGDVWPDHDEFILMDNFNGVHVNGVIDYLGFQNCPNFDNGNDRATCTLDFQLPADLPSGEYSIAWFWEFNPDSFYSTCWTAVVAAAGETATTTTVTTTTQTTTQTTTTQPVVTMDGECSDFGLAACTKGLSPPRGECIVTDANDPENGFICECEEGFVNANNPQTCNLENGIRIRIVLNVLFDSIANFDLFQIALEQDLANRVAADPNLDIDDARLEFTFSEGSGDDDGLVVVILIVSGASDSSEISAQTFFDALADGMGAHDFGYMSNMLSLDCLDCEDGADVAVSDSASSALVPSLVLVAGATAASTLMH